MIEDSDVIDKKELLLLECLLSDEKAFATAYSILKPEYFTEPLNIVVEFIMNHFVKYSNIPNSRIISAETGLDMDTDIEMTDKEREYLLDEIEVHCQEAAMTIAILKSADLVNDGNVKGVPDLVREAMLVKLDRHIGVNLFENAGERVISTDEDVISYSSGLKSIDDMIGKFRKREFYMIYAVSSGGKSLMLGNMSASLASQGLDVCVITLELDELLYAKRLDSTIVGVDIGKFKQHAETINQYYENLPKNHGSIHIKSMKAGTTYSEIDSYLLEYSLTTGKYPDVLVVDYIGLMGVSGMRGNTNKFDIDHEKAIGLIGMGQSYDMIVLSAGQINRDGYDTMKINPSHCAGGLSLINDCDGAFAMVASEEDLDNDQVQVVPLKIRHAKRGTDTPTLYRNPQTLKFTEDPVVQKKIESPIKKTVEKKEKKPMNSSEQISVKQKMRDALRNRG